MRSLKERKRGGGQHTAACWRFCSDDGEQVTVEGASLLRRFGLAVRVPKWAYLGPKSGRTEKKIAGRRKFRQNFTGRRSGPTNSFGNLIEILNPALK